MPQTMSDQNHTPFLWEEAYASGGSPLDSTYHDPAREEIINLIAIAPRHALDVGCANGAIGSKIKELYPDAQVMGIELNPKAAAIAKTKLDRVFTVPLERIDAQAEGLGWQRFDTVILADVL